MTLLDVVISAFHIYPDIKILNQNESTSEDGRKFYSFSLEAEASIKDINDWYRGSLMQEGWSIKGAKISAVIK